MACIPVPTAAIPELPAPLSVALPSTPAVPGIPGLCCKLPPVLNPIPPIPLGSLVLNSAIVEALNVYIDQVRAYVNALPFKCPVE